MIGCRDHVVALTSQRSIISDQTDQVPAAKVDIKSLIPSNIPAYLRIDVDIKDGLLKLHDLMRDYSNFDVLALEREVTRKLELELDQ